MVKREKQYNLIWRKHQETWWYWLWKGAKEPWRPSKKEIKFWEKIVKKVIKRENLRVLVMGATPEIRDMLAKYKNLEEVILVDINPLVKKAMDMLCQRKNPREKIVWANWLKMPFSKNYFDIVFLDGGFENISIKKHDLLHRKIKRVLKKNGYFLVGRACLECYFKRPLTFKKVIEKYKKDQKFFHNFYNRLWYMYRLAVSPESRSYNHKEQAVIMNVTVKELQAEAKKAGVKNIKYLTWYPGIDYGTTEYKEVDLESFKKLKSMLQKYFKIEKVYQDLFHPVMKAKYNFVLRPKK